MTGLILKNESNNTSSQAQKQLEKMITLAIQKPKKQVFVKCGLCNKHTTRQYLCKTCRSLYNRAYYQASKNAYVIIHSSYNGVIKASYKNDLKQAEYDNYVYHFKKKHNLTDKDILQEVIFLNDIEKKYQQKIILYINIMLNSEYYKANKQIKTQTIALGLEHQEDIKQRYNKRLRLNTIKAIRSEKQREILKELRLANTNNIRAKHI